MIDSVKKNKALVSIIIFLLITNVAMLVFFLVLNNHSPKPPRNHDGLSGMLQKDVGFSKQQLDAYESLRKGQLDSVHALFDELKKEKIDFYNMIYASSMDDSTLEAAAENIAAKQKELEIKMFYHFKTVRAICTPDQLPKFDSTLKKVVVRMISRAGKDAHNANTK
ncbi:MAG TPA: periplasmic heavy metal sensor [Chitinophagaceae bacterium]|nr:periplasmic heavy metal sensor [Chitinophagaceae bacterium]